MVQSSKKTATMTFRLDEDLIERLRAESKNREISTNTLVNQALKRFLEWDMYQTKIGLVSINKPVFVEIFEKFTQKEIIKIASHVGKNEVRDIALFMKGKIDLDSFISWFEMRMMNSSVQVSHSIEKDIHTYVMKHDLGKNWSIYHKTILELIFEEFLNKKIDVKYNKNMISFQFSV
ncbi:MAG: CopG family ribbon-helix-helix protein [Nitrosopumilaceae archaeon]